MEPDLFKRLAAPLLQPALLALADLGLPAALLRSLSFLLECSGLLAIAVILAAVAGSATRREATAVPRVVAAGAALVAAGLGLWIALHPSDQFDSLFTRWDHLLLAGAAGLALTACPPAARKWCLAGLGFAVLLQYAGLPAVALATALAGAGLGIMHSSWRGDTRRVALLQAALIAAAYGAAFWLRSRDVFTGMYVQGLLAFFTLRHISLMVSAHRGGPPPLADCAAYLAFYPGIMGFFGAPEVYDEFARRNLARPAGVQHRAAARRIVEGVGLVAVAQAMAISVARVEASASAPEAWACAIALFLRTALLVLGSWRLVDGAALFYGVRLRVNFTGLLTCRNPSELWWSWRGTLTNWLVQHVYGPLGGGRRLAFNILATFFVSFVWHALGVPFLSPDFHLIYIAPVALWAAINTAAVLGHATLTRHKWHPVAALLPDRVRIAGQVVLVWALGSLNPLLLAYQGPSAERLPDLLRLLLGLR